MVLVGRMWTVREHPRERECAGVILGQQLQLRGIVRGARPTRNWRVCSSAMNYTFA